MSYLARDPLRRRLTLLTYFLSSLVLGGASGLGSPTGTIGSGGGTGGAAVPTAINSVPGTGTDGTPASVAPASATTSPSSAMSFIIKDNSIWHLAAGVIGVVAAAAL